MRAAPPVCVTVPSQQDSNNASKNKKHIGTVPTTNN